MADTPEQFFAQFVVRAFEDFRKSPVDEYLGKTAVHYANVLAERMWRHYRRNDPGKVFDSTSASEFRERLAEHECPDFSLIRDVDDGIKHLVLDRKSRRVTSADQVGFEPTPWDRTPWDSKKWDGQIIVRADDGSRWDLLDILAHVLAMWERLLA